MVEMESLETNQTAESPIEDSNGNEVRSLKNDKISQTLLIVIAICGFSLLLLLALVLIVAVQALFGLDAPAVTAVEKFLGANSLGLVLTLVLIVTVLAAYFFLRRRVLGNPMFYTDAGCPQCWENELIRVRRQKKDRLIAHIGIPVRRYNCRNCDWGGLRLGGRPPTAEIEPEISSSDYFLGSDELLGVSQGETAAGEK